MGAAKAQMTSPSPTVPPAKSRSVLKIRARGEVICAFSHFRRRRSRSSSTNNLTIITISPPPGERFGTAPPTRTINLTYKKPQWGHEAASALLRAQFRTAQSLPMHNEPHHSPKPDASLSLCPHNRPHPAALRNISTLLSERSVSRFFLNREQTNKPTSRPQIQFIQSLKVQKVR